MREDATVVRPPVVVPASGNNIIINPIQRLNPVLECIRNVGKEFGDIVPDFQVGRTTGVLFLSLRYHRLHPEYIHQRIEKLGHLYTLRILLILCDISEHQNPIRELTKVCLINNITIIVAWSPDGVGHYLSTFKQYEHKPPDMIKERVDKDYHSILRTALTSVSKVNKTDVETLRTAFGSFAEVGKATSDQLQNLPGFGQVKVKKLKDAFDKPFRNSATTPLSFIASQPLHSSSNQADLNVTTLNKGKDRDPAPSSPARDIEFAMDEPPSTTMERPIPIHSNSQSVRRAPSPVWDIELDLNEDD